MSPKKKTIVKVFSSLVVITFIAGVILFFHFCSIHFADFQGAQTCTSVVFDKQKMLAVDRIELYNSQSHNSLTITDPAVIHSFVKETMVATSTDVQCPKDIEIKLFSGNELVRVMYCGEDYTFVNVYVADDLHWYLLKGTEPGEGYVLLSKNLQLLLRSLEM